MKFILRIKKQFIFGLSKCSGINFFGRKTIFTQGGGLKNKRYLVDYKRNIPFKYIILTIEKQLKVTGLFSLVCYENGLFSYILLNENCYIGNVLFGFTNYCFINSSSFIYNINTSNFLCNVENIPGSGGILARAAGLNCFLISKEKEYGFLKMNSGWLLKVSLYCIAVIGTISNSIHSKTRILNAGKNRKLGFRPRVRGVAMNPCDHAHGGGEGRSSPPVAHKTPYGKLTKVPTNRTKLLKKKKFNFKIF